MSCTYKNHGHRYDETRSLLLGTTEEEGGLQLRGLKCIQARQGGLARRASERDGYTRQNLAQAQHKRLNISRLQT